MTQNISKNKLLFKWLLTFLMPACILLIPTSETWTREINIFLAITTCGILMLIFEFFDPMVPCVLMPIFYMLLNVAPTSVIYSGWIGTTPMVVFGALLLVAVLDKTGIMERICYWIVSKTGGSFRGLIIGIYIAGFLTAFITSANSWAIYAVFTYGVAKCVGYADHSSRQGAIIVAVASLSVMSVYGTIYSPAVAGIFEPAFQAVIPDYKLTWTSHWWVDFPQWFFPILYIIVLLKFFTPKTKIPGKKIFKEKLDAMGPLSKDEKKTAIIFTILLIFLMTSSFHGIPCEWGFLIVPWLFFFPGIKIANTDTLKNMNYSMLFMIVCFLGIGAVASYLELNTMVANGLRPLLEPVVNSTFAGPIIAGLIYLICTVMNLILTPYAIYAAFTGPLAQLVTALGMDPQFLYYVLALAGDSLILPYESVGYLIFFSFGLISLKDWIKLFSVKLIMQFLFIIFILVPWWSWVGIM